MKRLLAVLLAVLLVAAAGMAQAAKKGGTVFIFPEGFYTESNLKYAEDFAEELNEDLWGGEKRIQPDAELCRWARLRAQELAFYYNSTTRPNGRDSIETFPAGRRERIEFRAAAYGTAREVFDAWKSDPEKAKILANEALTCLGFGHVRYNHVDYWVLCLSSIPEKNSKGLVQAASAVEIDPDLVKLDSLSVQEVTVRQEESAELSVRFTMEETYPNYHTFEYRPYPGLDGSEVLDWASDNEKVLTVENQHDSGIATVTGVSPGKATVTGTVFGKKIRMTCFVNGETVRDGWRYFLDVRSGTAMLLGPAEKNPTELTVPATIKYEKKTYAVTGIAEDACKGLKKLTSVTIGKNVARIGAGAFSGCTKLSAVTIGKKVAMIGAGAFSGCGKLKAIKVSTKLLTTAETIGEDAFAGIHQKAVFTCPKGLAETYESLFRQKGAPAGAKFQ